MSKNLVIVESPAKAKTIEKFLGKGYVVKSSMGHVHDLPEKKLGIDIKNNFLPLYEILKEKTKKPILSAEIFVIPLEDNRYLIYAPLRKAAFIGNSQIVNFLADLKDNIYNTEIDTDGATIEFLRRLEMIDAGEEIKPINIYKGKPKPVSLALFPTTACNLRCTYCYASAGDTVIENMPLSVAKRGIDFVIKNAVEQKVTCVEINYHGGGEPTTNWRTLTGSLEYAQKKAADSGLTINASCATNGMLNDKQIDWFVANMQGATISFDGMPEAQDKHRVRPAGKGSSAKVIQALRRFDEANFNYAVRMTATAELIPYMADSVDYIFSNFRTNAVQIEPAFKLGRYANQLSAETEEFITAFREAQYRAKKYGKEITYSGARLGILTNHFCAFSRDMFALLSDGTVSSCFEACTKSNPHREIFYYGQEDEQNEGYCFDMKRLNFLRKQSVQNRKYCQDCFVKWHCAGDCYHKAVAEFGKKKFMGTNRCHINRELTKDQIFQRIEDAGGLCWHELPEHLIGQVFQQTTEIN